MHWIWGPPRQVTVASQPDAPNMLPGTLAPLPGPSRCHSKCSARLGVHRLAGSVLLRIVAQHMLKEIARQLHETFRLWCIGWP